MPVLGQEPGGEAMSPCNHAASKDGIPGGTVKPEATA
jgi:hypothetical protein